MCRKCKDILVNPELIEITKTKSLICHVSKGRSIRKIITGINICKENYGIKICRENTGIQNL